MGQGEGLGSRSADTLPYIETEGGFSVLCSAHLTNQTLSSAGWTRSASAVCGIHLWSDRFSCFVNIFSGLHIGCLTCALHSRPSLHLETTTLRKWHWCIYLLTPWNRVTVFTSARHLSLSWANSIQSPPHPTFRRSILISSSHLRLGLPNGLFPSGFPTRTLCTPLPSPIRATCPAHLILLNFTTRTILGKE